MEKIENLPELQETLFRKGFPKELAEEVEAKVKAGETEFFVEYYTEIKQAEMGFRIHFRADEEKGKVYLNSFDAALLNHPEGLREQHISAHTLITAGEAFRMLNYGTLVAVNKDLFNKEGQKYNVWLSFDVSGPKDEYDNYPVLSYHENYYKKRPFDVKAALQDLPVPVKELENPYKLADYEIMLKKANTIEVTILHNGEEQQGLLCVNPKEGWVDVYDKDHNLIERQQQKAKAIQGQQRAPEMQTSEKKKSWGKGQQVNRTPKNQQHKGIS